MFDDFCKLVQCHVKERAHASPPTVIVCENAHHIPSLSGIKGNVLVLLPLSEATKSMGLVRRMSQHLDGLNVQMNQLDDLVDHLTSLFAGNETETAELLVRHQFSSLVRRAVSIYGPNGILNETANLFLDRPTYVKGQRMRNELLFQYGGNHHLLGRSRFYGSNESPPDLSEYKLESEKFRSLFSTLTKYIMSVKGAQRQRFRFAFVKLATGGGEPPEQFLEHIARDLTDFGLVPDTILGTVHLIGMGESAGELDLPCSTLERLALSRVMAPVSRYASAASHEFLKQYPGSPFKQSCDRWWDPLEPRVSYHEHAKNPKEASMVCLTGGLWLGDYATSQETSQEPINVNQ